MRKNYSIRLPALVISVMIVVLLILAMVYRHSKGNEVLILSVSAIVLLVVWNAYLHFDVFSPLQQLKNKIEDLAYGDDNIKMKKGTVSEFREIEETLSEHRQRIVEIRRIAEKLAQGDTGLEFHPVSERDFLGQAIEKLRESIMLSGLEMEKRRKLDEQQNWASRGLAKFGELLRDFDQQTEDLSSLFIRELVKYTDMEAGGFFIRRDNGDETVFALMGAWAFDREKKLRKEFRPGEGLVGRCAVEKQRIVITDVPKDYLRIRSGMGEDLPSTLILVPVVLDNDVLGIIEMATFNIVKPYKINFLEKLGISIATSVSKVTST